ncbi:MAG TPA: hypothetical protein VLD17_03710 [Gemmatimonadaceae bacterium]|nr:hypothetical protein [Gemmatimonadaceae bacterium]
MAQIDQWRESPFYAWLDRAEIRHLLRRAQALTPGERLILMKGLIPKLVRDIGDANVRAFLDELTTNAERFAEAMAHPGEGGATRQTPSERLGGPVPGQRAHWHLPGTRNPRRPGGRALEREWEAAAWDELRGEQSAPEVGL